MSGPRLNGVIVKGDNSTAKGGANEAVIVGERGSAESEMAGISYAGRLGSAQTGDYGVAICAANGKASGGAESLVFAIEGGRAEGVQGAVVWARTRGEAKAGEHGVAITANGDARAGLRGIAIAANRYENEGPFVAEAAVRGVAIARTTDDSQQGTTIIAKSGAGGIAIGLDGHEVQGEVGALLIIAEELGPGSYRFKVARVDGATVKANHRYSISDSADFTEL